MSNDSFNYKETEQKNSIQAKIDIANYVDSNPEVLKQELYQRFMEITTLIHEYYCNKQFVLFFQAVHELKELVQNCLPPHIPGLIENQILIIFIEILSDDSFIDSNLPVILCLSEITKSKYVCDFLIENNFIRLLSLHIKKETDIKLFTLLYTLLNIIKAIENQNYIDQILFHFSIDDLFIVARSTKDISILITTFSLLCKLSFYALSPENEESLFRFISFFFGIICYIGNDESIHMIKNNVQFQTCFPRNCLTALYYQAYYNHINLDSFAEKNLFVMLNYYLQFPPVEVHKIVCQIFSLFIKNYDKTVFPFEFRPILDLYFVANSEGNQVSAANAMNDMLQMDSNFSSFFFENKCSIFFTFLDTIFSISVATKAAYALILLKLLKLVKLSDWTLIFEKAILLSIDENDDNDSNHDNYNQNNETENENDEIFKGTNIENDDEMIKETNFENDDVFFIETNIENDDDKTVNGEIIDYNINLIEKEKRKFHISLFSIMAEIINFNGQLQLVALEGMNIIFRASISLNIQDHVLDMFHQTFQGDFSLLFDTENEIVHAALKEFIESYFPVEIED